MSPLPVALVINSPPHPLRGFTVYLLDKTPVKLTKTLLFLVQIAQESQSTLPQVLLLSACTLPHPSCAGPQGVLHVSFRTCE